VDNEPELARRLGVQGIQALFVLKNGSVVARQAGLANLSTL
jgi:thioredoxin-like negative regulator of GroEL